MLSSNVKVTEVLVKAQTLTNPHRLLCVHKKVCWGERTFPLAHGVWRCSTLICVGSLALNHIVITKLGNLRVEEYATPTYLTRGYVHIGKRLLAFQHSEDVIS